MYLCHQCHKPASGRVKYQIEVETESSNEKYLFDTKACMVSWVQKTYMVSQ